MPAPRGVRSQHIADAREVYLLALEAWSADPRRAEPGRASAELVTAAAEDLVTALRAAGVQGKRRPLVD